MCMSPIQRLEGHKKGHQRQLEALVISSASLCSEEIGGLGSYREDPASRNLDDSIQRGRVPQGDCRPFAFHTLGLARDLKRERLELMLALAGVQRPEQAADLLLSRGREVGR